MEAALMNPLHDRSSPGLLTDGWGGKKAPFRKICHTYSKMMKLNTVIPYLNKIQKICITWHTPSFLLTSLFFHRKSANFAISWNTDIDCIFIHNFYLISYIIWIFKDCFNKYDYNFDDVSQNGHSKSSQNIFILRWNEIHDFIISVHDVTKKIISSDSNYVVDVIIWPKFGSYSISMREVIINSIL